MYIKMHIKRIVPLLFIGFILAIPGCKKHQPASSLKDITAFNFEVTDNPFLKANAQGVVDQTDDTIRIGLPPGTDLSHLVPTIAFDGASINPANKTAANFTTNVRYTVIAQDGSAKSYIVVTRLLSNAKAITAFVFRRADNPTLATDVSGVIGTDTIRVYTDPGTDLTHLVPAITYTGSRIYPANLMTQDFSYPLRYVVTAEDDSSKGYTVIVSGNRTVYVGSNDNSLYALDAATGVLRWEATTNGPINSSPTYAGATVYVGSDDGYLYAFDATTGILRWKTATRGPVQGSPTVAGGMVYVDNSSSGNDYTTSALTAFDTATGSQQWRYNLPGPYNAQGPTVLNGIVYQTNPFYAPGLGAFDAVTGSELWQPFDPNGFRWNPAVVNGTIYAGSVDFPLVAIDSQTHQVKWVYMDIDSHGSPVVIGSNGSPTVEGNTVFIPTYNDDMYAIDAGAGTLKWKFSQTSGISVNGEFSSPVAGNGLLFAANSNGLVYAVDLVTGAVQWKYGTPNGSSGPGPAANPTLANGILYTGCTTGNFCALDARNGGVKWTFATGGTVLAGPCVTDAKGNVYHPGISGDHQ